MKYLVLMIACTLCTCSTHKNKNRGNSKRIKQGEVGPEGPAGVPGPAGENGKDGKDGNNGTNGNGTRGPAGNDGQNGIPGEDGMNGEDGNDGNDGMDSYRVVCQYRSRNLNIFYKIKRLQDRSLYVALCSGCFVTENDCSRGTLAKKTFLEGDPAQSTAPIDNGIFNATLIDETSARIRGRGFDAVVGCL